MRMKNSPPLISAALLILIALPLRATPLDDRVAELKHAIEKEAAAKANGANAQNGIMFNQGMSPAFIEASIDQIVAQMQNPSFGGNMDAQLMQMTSMYTSDEVQEATKNLLSEVKKERKDRSDAEMADIQALITRATQAITQAKKPEDLDDLITAMAKYQNFRYGMDSALQQNRDLSRQFSAAFEFIKHWQDYLAHVSSGQAEQAHNDLRMMMMSNTGPGLIPRSKLLEMDSSGSLTGSPGHGAGTPSAPAAQAQAIVDGIKTLDDIKPALLKLEPLRQSDMSELQVAYSQLNQMQSDYENLKAGLPVQGYMNPGFNSGPVTMPPGLRAQLLLLTLQNEFDSFKGTPPVPGEKPTAFLDRVIADATTREDWNLLRHADAARNSLRQNTGDGAASPSDTSGVNSIIAGAHQEAAGQFALAVQSYETALKSDDPAIPSKILGDKLAAIQRDHPKEYADGMQLTVSPPAPHIYQNPNSSAPGGVAPAPAPIPSTLLSPAAK